MKTNLNHNFRILFAAALLMGSHLIALAQPAAPMDCGLEGIPPLTPVVADFKVHDHRSHAHLAPHRGSVIEVPQGDSIAFAYHGTPGVTCEWNFGDGRSVLSNQRQGHVYHESGLYELTQTVIGEGGSSATKHQLIRVLPKLTLQPVATGTANRGATVRFLVQTQLNGETGKLRVTDLTGRDVLMAIQTNAPQGELYLGTLPAGDYYIRVESATVSRLVRVSILPS